MKLMLQSTMKSSRPIQSSASRAHDEPIQFWAKSRLEIFRNDSDHTPFRRTSPRILESLAHHLESVGPKMAAELKAALLGIAGKIGLTPVARWSFYVVKRFLYWAICRDDFYD
jgi:hypothetical protein